VTEVVALRDVFSVHRTNEGDAAALQGATLTVKAGESVCVLGPSGAGKTTLLQVIAGLQTPSAGAVRVLGRDIGRASARVRARIRHQSLGLLGQRSGSTLSPDLPLRDGVALPLALRGTPRAARRGPRRCWAPPGWATGSASGPASSRGASANEPRCAWPSPTVRRCCSPTSPPASWMPPAGAPC
jgi:putative ABC transport system ATP-binding protein